MSNSTPNKPKKTGKPNKSSAKATPNIEISCKFRGKYDLNKKKSNREINQENAMNLFEVVYKKNKNLSKEINIKMFKDKKMFSFGDKTNISKVHHRVKYIEVSKFFVLHKDPTMIIMGVNHKTHRWFLVFQFNNAQDLTRFCDEIEGKKNMQIKPNEENLPQDGASDTKIESMDVVDFQEVYEDPRDFENISLHTAVLNTKEMTAVNFDESYYQPDLNIPNMNEPEALSMCSSRPSSRSSSSSDTDNRIHCNDLSHSRLKDLRIKSGNNMYSNIEFCEEDLKCLNYSNKRNNLLEVSDKIGPIYMYCAQFKNKERREKISDDVFSQNIFYKPNLNKEIKNNSKDFHHFEPKLITDKTHNFDHFEPKLLFNESEGFSHYEPKLNKSENLPKFEHFEPKFISIYN